MHNKVKISISTKEKTLIMIIMLLMFCIGCQKNIFTNKHKDEIDKRVGNTSGNINNSGYVTERGSWVYYCNTNNINDSGLFKTNGKEEIKLSTDVCNNINVVDDWVYYTIEGEYKIYKIGSDGKDRMKVSDDLCDYVNVVDDWIYYINYSDNDKVYKIKIDGTQKMKIYDFPCGRINISDGWLYACRKNSDDYNEGYDDAEFEPVGELYKVKIDSLASTKVCEDIVTYINIVGDWIYYCNVSDDMKLYKIKTDGSQRTKLNDDQSFYINAKGDWIFYVNVSDTFNIYKIKTNGEDKTQLNNYGRCMNLNLVNNYIYYDLYANENDGLYKMKFDGSENTMVK